MAILLEAWQSEGKDQHIRVGSIRSDSIGYDRDTFISAFKQYASCDLITERRTENQSEEKILWERPNK